MEPKPCNTFRDCLYVMHRSIDNARTGHAATARMRTPEVPRVAKRSSTSDGRGSLRHDAIEELAVRVKLVMVTDDRRRTVQLLRTCVFPPLVSSVDHGVYHLAAERSEVRG